MGVLAIFGSVIAFAIFGIISEEKSSYASSGWSAGMHNLSTVLIGTILIFCIIFFSAKGYNCENKTIKINGSEYKITKRGSHSTDRSIISAENDSIIISYDTETKKVVSVSKK